MFQKYKKHAMAYAALGGLKHFFKSNTEAIDISNATFTFAKFVLFNHTPIIVAEPFELPQVDNRSSDWLLHPHNKQAVLW